MGTRTAIGARDYGSSCQILSAVGNLSWQEQNLKQKFKRKSKSKQFSILFAAAVVLVNKPKDQTAKIQIAPNLLLPLELHNDIVEV